MCEKNPITTDTHMEGFFDGADAVAKAMASTTTAATQGVPIKAPVPLPELVFVKQTDSGIYINQAKYARNLVKRFGLDKAAHARIPMAANAKLTNDPSGKSVDVTLYRRMIGCLLYLSASRPNIAFSVGVCSRFQSNPKVSHLNTVKRIIKYVSGTCDYGLFYS